MKSCRISKREACRRFGRGEPIAVSIASKESNKDSWYYPYPNGSFTNFRDLEVRMRANVSVGSKLYWFRPVSG